MAQSTVELQPGGGHILAVGARAANLSRTRCDFSKSSVKIPALFLQAFVQKPVAVEMPYQEFDLVASTVCENIETAVGRVAAELVGNQNALAVDGLWHVYWVAVEKYLLGVSTLGVYRATPTLNSLTCTSDTHVASVRVRLFSVATLHSAAGLTNPTLGELVKSELDLIARNQARADKT